MPVRIAIFTEYGPNIGHGHAIRSRALQSYIRHADLFDEVSAVQVYERGAGRKWPEGVKADIVIRDIVNGVGTVLPRVEGVRFVVDISDTTYELDGTADMSFSIYGVDAGAQFAGLQYAILRPLFLQKRSPRTREGVVVTLGGTDPSVSSRAIVDSLRGMPRRKYSVTGIIPPGGDDNLEEHEAFIKTERMDVQLGRAKISVTSAGMTMLESACVGTPPLVVAHNDREADRMDRIMDGASVPTQLFMCYLGRAQNLDHDRLHWTVNRLMTGDGLRCHMASVAKATVTGRGGPEVAKQIMGAVRRLTRSRKGYACKRRRTVAEAVGEAGQGGGNCLEKPQ